MFIKTVRLLIGVTAVLLVLFFGASPIEGVSWSLFDFLVLGLLLFIPGFLYILISPRISRRCRFIVSIVLIIVAVFIWAELAVGLVGSPFAGN